MRTYTNEQRLNQIENKYAKTFIKERLMSGDGMDPDEWVETIQMAADGELDDVAEDLAEELSLSEYRVYALLRIVAEEIMSDNPEMFEGEY